MNTYLKTATSLVLMSIPNVAILYYVLKDNKSNNDKNAKTE